MANHTAAIHVLKSKLQFSDEDYRALLNSLTAKSSTTEMSDKERQAVRDHMQGLAVRMGVAKPFVRRRTFAQAKAEASPRERKVWALWHQLHRDGLVHDASAFALNAWVQRTVHVSALAFCTDAQLDTCIEALKAWVRRRGDA